MKGEMPSNDPAPSQPRLPSLPPHFGLVTLVAALFYLMVEWSFSSLAEFDAFYNVGVARLYLHHGFLRQFPWMQMSILRDHFNDPQLLLHLLLMVPLALGVDPTIAGKLIAALLATALTATFYWFLCRQRVRWPIAWTLVSLGASAYALARLSFIRSTAPFLVITLVFLDAVKEGRTRRLWLLGALAVWTYQGFPFLGALLLLWLGARALLGEDKFRFEPLQPLVGGFLIGLVVNPFFPNDLSFLNVEIVRHLLIKPKELVLSSEWAALDTAHFLVTIVLPLTLLFFAELVAAAARLPLDATRLFYFVVTVLLLFGAMVSVRVVEYFTPFALITVAITLSRATESWSLLASERTRRAAWGVGLFLCLPAVVMNIKDAIAISASIAEQISPADYASVAAWLSQNSDDGELVVTQWDDFPMLFFNDQKNHYLFGLNPVYGFTFDERRFNVHNLLYQARLGDPEAFLADLHARFLVVARADRFPERQKLMQMLRANPHFELAFSSNDTHIFRRLP
jgi:hypothetical protein